MVDPIRPNPSSVSPSSGIQKEQTPKIDRQFGAFIDEALKKSDAANSPYEVKLSNHAEKRLEERGLRLNQDDRTKLEEAVQTLEEKGSKNSLILLDDLALIASVQNKTIITALRSDEMTEVTNIDSAIKISKDA